MTLIFHLHFSPIADVFVRSDLWWEKQSKSMQLRPMWIKHYHTVLNHLVQVQLPTNGAGIWRGSEEGYKQQKRKGGERKVLSGEQVLSEELCLQELSEGREGWSCSHRAQEVLPPLGKKVCKESGMPCLDRRPCQTTRNHVRMRGSVVIDYGRLSATSNCGQAVHYFSINMWTYFPSWSVNLYETSHSPIRVLSRSCWESAEVLH